MVFVDDEDGAEATQSREKKGERQGKQACQPKLFSSPTSLHAKNIAFISYILYSIGKSIHCIWKAHSRASPNPPDRVLLVSKCRFETIYTTSKCQIETAKLNQLPDQLTSHICLDNLKCSFYPSFDLSFPRALSRSSV